jgi:hypothetical protein
MSIHSPEQPEEPELEQQPEPGRWQSVRQWLGLFAVETGNERGRNDSVSNGNGVPTNGDGHADEPLRPGPITAMEVLERLERNEAEQTPPGFPEPYKIGIQEYPGNALWRGINSPEEAAAVLRTIGKLDPPHVLAERAAAADD